MGKSSPAPPEPVKIDPWETAQSQFEFGKKASLYNKLLQQSTFQQTPYGSLTYENVAAPGEGKIYAPPGGAPEGAMSAPPVAGLTEDQKLAERFNIGEAGVRELRGDPNRNYLLGGQSISPLDRAGLGVYEGPSSTAPTVDRPAGAQASYSGGVGQGEIPITRMVQTLHPAEQRLLDQQRALKSQYGDIASQLMGKAGGMFSTPLDMASLGEMPIANEATRQSVIDSMIGRFQPQQDRDRAALETRLVNQGFGMGAEGWQSAMDEINRRETDFRLAANLQGGNEMRADLAQQMGARQLGIQELLLPRNQTLQELATFTRGSQPTMPQFAPINAPQVAAPDFAGLAMSSANMENQANMNAYNAQMQNQGSGLGSLLGTAAGAYFGGPWGASIGGGLGGGFDGWSMGGGSAADVSNWG